MGEHGMRITALAGKPVLDHVRYDLTELGYTNDEFVLEGRARSYSDDTQALFTTRLVVRRPIDVTQSNGTVFVEWLNVSGGLDVAVEWTYAHRHLMRKGFSWVGVSVQRAGIEGGGIAKGLHLKLADSGRYESLSHPGDAYAFSIFTQAAQVLRENPEALLGNPGPHRLLGCGQSQSASFLTTYINVVDEETGILDGYLVHGRPAAQADLSGSMPTVRLADVGIGETIGRQLGDRAAPIRGDVRVPVLTLQAECDVAVLRSFLARQPDADRHRLWEVAGTSHADTYMLSAHASDDGRLPAAELARALSSAQPLPGMATSAPINSGPQFHYVMQAAIEHLDRWVGGGEPPPYAGRLDIATPEAADPLARDELGNALSGIRSPWLDVPTSTLSGVGQRGGSFTFLFGSTTAFDAEALKRLYPRGRSDYLAQFSASLEETIAAGFILPDDRLEILALAEAATPASLG
jgi:hypothetical protein